MEFDQQYDKSKSVSIMPVEVKAVKSLSNGTVDIVLGSQDGQSASRAMQDMAPWLHKCGSLVFIPQKDN